MSLAALREIERERRRLPLASRRQPARADARTLDRDPASARRRHHHGVRRVHAVPGDAGAGAPSLALSMRWAERSRRAFRERPGYGIFGIVQGGVYAELRQSSAAALREIGFDGYAVGGLAVGEGQETMFRVLDDTVPGAARGAAALPHGGRQAGRHRRRRRARHRHVRLRPADPLGPHGAGLHPRTARSTCATPAMPRTRRRSTPNAPAPPAPATVEPISTTSAAAARSSVACC